LLRSVHFDQRVRLCAWSRQAADSACAVSASRSAAATAARKLSARPRAAQRPRVTLRAAGSCDERRQCTSRTTQTAECAPPPPASQLPESALAVSATIQAARRSTSSTRQSRAKRCAAHDDITVHARRASVALRRALAAERRRQSEDAESSCAVGAAAGASPVDSPLGDDGGYCAHTVGPLSAQTESDSRVRSAEQQVRHSETVSCARCRRFHWTAASLLGRRQA